MVGIDEVGRGCLAGPLLVVAARAKSKLPEGLKDSKLLTREQREGFYKTLIDVCDYGEGWVTAAEINKLGLARCLKLGVRRAVASLDVQPDEEIIMDGTANYIPKKFMNSRCEAKADNNYPVVSAASIIAKVKRDSFMRELAKKHSRYGFESHVGYGTKAHYLAIEKFGPLKSVHRMGFAPFIELTAEA
ncbi:MAG TPA: ribonuclease HII [Candidatus Saccharimonadales bacterium]|nr:ribonuclease HII [Candidatus Saccharimonadales bacterium]